MLRVWVMSSEKRNLLDIIVDEKAFKAFIRPAEGVDPQLINAQNLANELLAAKIAINDTVKARMREFLDRIASRKQVGKFLIAEAQLPIEAQPGEFLWHDLPPNTPSSDDAFNSLIERSAVIVAPGQIAGKVIPPKAGKAGLNVYSETLLPKTIEAEPVQLDESVRLADDGVTVIANRSGRIVCDSQRAAVLETVNIDGGIKPCTEKLDWKSDVIVHGTVGESSKLATTKSLIVADTIEAVDVQVGGNVIVHCGIIGKGKGHVVAPCDVAAKFFEDADVQAGRDVYIGTSTINSRIQAAGFLYASNASIVGGETHARRGIEALCLGSESAASTYLHVGVSLENIRNAKELDELIRERRARVEQINASLAPLQANLKHLTSSQKEQVTELSFESDALKDEIAEAEEQRSQLFGEAIDNPYVRATSMIYEGVQITIEDLSVTISSDLKGPVHITRTKIRNATEIVAVSEISDSITVLKSKPADNLSTKTAKAN